MEIKSKLLYKLESTGKFRLWECTTGQLDGEFGIFMSDGIEGGKMRVPKFKVAKETNVGKANYKSAEEQSHILMDQTVRAKLSKKYGESKEEASNIKLWLPMLCPSGMKYRKYIIKKPINWITGLWVSPKLDGVRGIFGYTIKYVLQSREGKKLPSFKHLQPTIDKLKELYPSFIFDSELYNHKYKDNFSKLISLVKKDSVIYCSDQESLSAHLISSKTKTCLVVDFDSATYNHGDVLEITAKYKTGQPVDTEFFVIKGNIKDVRINMYDLFDVNEDDLLVSERQLLLQEIKELNLPYVDIILSTRLTSSESYDKYHEDIVELGYEGTIGRREDTYEPDKRSDRLLKRKDMFDAEFIVTRIEAGAGSYKDRMVRVFLDLRSSTGMDEEDKVQLVFDDDDMDKAGIGAGVDEQMCKDFLNNPETIVMKRCTIEYFGITEHGKLRFPKFKVVRDYE